MQLPSAGAVGCWGSGTMPLVGDGESLLLRNIRKGSDLDQLTPILKKLNIIKMKDLKLN